MKITEDRLQGLVDLNNQAGELGDMDFDAEYQAALGTLCRESGLSVETVDRLQRRQELLSLSPLAFKLMINEVSANGETFFKQSLDRIHESFESELRELEMELTLDEGMRFVELER